MNLQARSSHPSAPKLRRLAFAGLTLALLAFGGAKVSGFVLTGTQWPAGTVTFQMALGNAGRTLTDGNTSWDTAAAPAATLWNNKMGTLTVLVPANPSAPVSQGDRVNTVAFASSYFGSSFGSNTLAITGWSYSGGRTVEADILFNNRINWDSYRGNLRFGGGGSAVGEIRRVLLHEMGHALGLKHPDQAGQNVSAVMNSIVSNVELPTNDDTAGIQRLYGASSGPTPTPTPSATPTPTPSATPTPTPSATPTPTVNPTATPSVRTVTLSAAPTKVRSGTATFAVAMTPANPIAATTIRFTMTGTAKSGTHYRLNTTQFTVPAGATSSSVTLSVVKAASTSRSATMNLSTGSGYTLGTPKTATVTISR